MQTPGPPRGTAIEIISWQELKRFVSVDELTSFVLAVVGPNDWADPGFDGDLTIISNNLDMFSASNIWGDIQYMNTLGSVVIIS